MHRKKERMLIFPFFKNHKEEFNVGVTKPEVKSILAKKDKEKIFFKWLTEDQFIVSLNFSIGTNYAFDIDHKSKSAIYAYGTISQLKENEIHIKIETKYKYGLLAIIMIPVVLLLLELTIDLDTPLFLYVIPFILFVFVSFIFRSEEKRLIQYFQEEFKNCRITHYNIKEQ